MEKEYIHKILAAALEINGLGARAKEETGDKPTVFVEFFGHTGVLTVSIHKNGWYPHHTPDYSEFIKLGSLTSEEDLRRTYKYLTSSFLKGRNVLK